MNFTKTDKEMPIRDGRGRPCIYNLHKIEIGKGKEIAVNSIKLMKTIRGKLFASASYFRIKITTVYNDGVLTVWRVK